MSDFFITPYPQWFGKHAKAVHGVVFVTPSLMSSSISPVGQALTGLITAETIGEAYSARSMHVSGWLKMLALSQLIPSIFLSHSKRQVSRLFINLAFLKHRDSLEIRVVATVSEISQIGHYSFGSFSFEQVNHT